MGEYAVRGIIALEQKKISFPRDPDSTKSVGRNLFICKSLSNRLLIGESFKVYIINSLIKGTASVIKYNKY